MTDFLLSYDLRNESGSHDYQVLWDELKRVRAHRTQDSLWLVNFNNTAREVHEHIKGFVDGNDRLWISELTKNHWYSNARGGTNEWLEVNPPSR
jgi:hypothetical protein